MAEPTAGCGPPVKPNWPPVPVIVTPLKVGPEYAEKALLLILTVAVHAPLEPPSAVMVPVSPFICVIAGTLLNVNATPVASGFDPLWSVTVTTADAACDIPLIA